MDEQLRAVREVTEFLNGHAIKHLVIGGIANAVWGEPRATQDADFKIIVGDRQISELVSLVGEEFAFRVGDPLAFAQRTYVLPVVSGNQIPVDLALAFLPYETQAVDRGVLIRHQDVEFLVWGGVDLIIQKAVSEREKDWSDIEGILIRQRESLDQNYIVRWLDQFAEALERPSLVHRYRELCRRVGIV